MCCWWEHPTTVLSLSASWLPSIIQLTVIIWDRRLPPADPEFTWLISTQGEPGSAAQKSVVWGETGLPAACTFLKSQLHAYYSSPGMKPTSHVASPLPQHTLAYLSHVAPSASHCCQKWRAGLLITCQWAWREGRSINAHPGAKRFTHELGKPASTAQMGRFAGEGGTMAAMGHEGKRWLWRRSGVLSLLPCGPHPVGHLL